MEATDVEFGGVAVQSLGRPRPSLGLVAGLVGALLFLASWSLLSQFAGRNQLGDTPLYKAYGDAFRVGDLPYRDYLLEYPPAALVAFVVPNLTVAPEDVHGFGVSFRRWMGLCGLAATLSTVVALRRLGVAPRDLVARVALVAVSPLLLGSVILFRFDLLPAALAAAALAVLLTGRGRAAFFLLALSAAVKLYALVCFPLFLVYVWRRAGRRAAAVCAAIFGVTTAAVFGPVLALAPAGLAHSFAFQLDRPLQIESLGAALLAALHNVAGLRLTLANGHNSVNMVGTLPSLVANAMSVIQVGLVLLVVVAFSRGAPSNRRLVTAVAAAVASFVAFDKVLSPQYLIWLVPLVPLILDRCGVIASALLVGALCLTHLYFPSHYAAYAFGLRPLESVTVLVRDLLLVALSVSLLLHLRPRGGPAASPAPDS